MATILITHDLGLAAEYCQRIVVMHAGHIVEDAPTAALMTGAQHPYSAKLIAATPAASVGLDALASIPGNLPDLRRADLPPCRYSQRCERRTRACDQPLPRRELGNGHAVACWNPL
jgi:peptide/nickel transport system ATP-binding protein